MAANRRGTMATLSAYEYGVRCDGNTLCGAALNSALSDAAAMGYLRVQLSGLDPVFTHQVIWIDQNVNIPSNVELWGPPGLVVMAWKTLTGPMFQTKQGGEFGVKLSGGWIIDGNSSGGANVIGVEFDSATLCEIDGVTVQHAAQGGYLLSGCSRLILRAARAAYNGQDGFRFANTRNCQIYGCEAIDNSQASAGTYNGFSLGGSSEHNVFAGCVGYDDSGNPTQGYGWAEDSAGFTGDYNVFAASDFNGNKTGNVRVEGANSGSTTTGTFSAATISGSTLTGTTTNSGTISGGTIDNTTLTGTLDNTSGTISGGIVQNAEVKGPKLGVRSTTGPSPVAVATLDAVLEVDASGGAITVDLPAATGSGDYFIITKADSSTNAVTITPYGSDTIDGFTSRVIGSQYGTVVVYDTKTANWQTFSGGPVGPSDHPRLNAYYLPTGIIPTSQVTGTGDVAANTAFTVQGLSSTAVVVKMRVAFSCNTVGAYVSLFDSSSATFVSASVPVLGNAVPAEMYVEMRVTPGSTNQIYYRISGTSAAAWTLSAYCLGYVEQT